MLTDSTAICCALLHWGYALYRASALIVALCAAGKTHCLTPARPDTSSSRTANWNDYADATSGRTRSRNVLPKTSMPNSPGAHDVRDSAGCGV